MKSQYPIERYLNELRQANYDAERFSHFACRHAETPVFKNFFCAVRELHRGYREQLTAALEKQYGRIKNTAFVFSDAFDALLWEISNILSNNFHEVMLKKLYNLETLLLRHYTASKDETGTAIPELLYLLQEQHSGIEHTVTNIKEHLQEIKKQSLEKSG